MPAVAFVAYLTEALLVAEFGAPLVAKLTKGSATTLARRIASAEARVESALQIGGYTAAVPANVFAADASNCPEAIKELAVRVWKRVAYERTVDLSIPADQIRAIETELADVENGRLEIKGLARSTARAPGGVLGSNSTNPNGARYRPAVFTRDRLKAFR